MRNSIQLPLTLVTIGVLCVCCLLTMPQTKILQPPGRPSAKKPSIKDAIVWKDCTPADLEKLPDNQNHIVIVAGDWTLTGCFGDVRNRIETPALRKLVSRDSIHCWHCDITAEVDAQYFFETATRLQIDHRHMAPHVLLKRGKDWAFSPLRGDTVNLDSTQKLIHAAFAPNTNSLIDLRALSQEMLAQQEKELEQQHAAANSPQFDFGLKQIQEPKLQAKYYLLEGGKQGVLEVKLDLHGWETFAMTHPKGSIGIPITIRLDKPKQKIEPPKGLKSIGPWTPDNPPRIETWESYKLLVHRGTITWRARFTIAEGVDASTWNFKIYFNGQFVNDNSAMPIKETIPVTFAGAIKKEELEKLPPPPPQQKSK